MIKTLWIGASALNANQTYLDSASNNIANVNTQEYKAEKTRFSDLLYTHYPRGNSTQRPGYITTEESMGNGVRIGDVKKIFNPGNIKATENPMDLAINGAGFIKVITPNGEERYSRGGALTVNEGVLGDMAGNKISPDIQLPDNWHKFTISTHGRVTAFNTNGDAEVIGDIPIYNFVNPGGLIAQDNKLYVETEQSGLAVEGVPGELANGSFHQGFTEMSNVDLIQEMARLMEAQRAYQINTRSIKTADDMWAMANNLRGK